MSAETEVLFFDLYNKLSRRLRKVVANGTEVPFSQEDIEIVLRYQGISNSDLLAAIRWCLSRGILKKEGDSFFVTESGLAAYHADLRRIYDASEVFYFFIVKLSSDCLKTHVCHPE